MTELEIENIDWRLYDFVDLGCSNGSSILHCMKRFSRKRGVGVDINPRKVASARGLGYEAVVADATQLNLDRQVSFVSMMNFLEHLPDLSVVESVIAAAARSAQDFLYIRHPSFEGEALGAQVGFGQYWWNWTGHPSHITVADYCRIFERLGLRSYSIRYVEKISTLSHATIVPAGEVNLNAATASSIVTPDIPLLQAWWRRQDIFVPLRSFDPEEWETITRRTKQDIRYERLGF